MQSLPLYKATRPSVRQSATAVVGVRPYIDVTADRQSFGVVSPAHRLAGWPVQTAASGSVPVLRRRF